MSSINIDHIDTTGCLSDKEYRQNLIRKRLVELEHEAARGLEVPIEELRAIHAETLELRGELEALELERVDFLCVTCAAGVDRDEPGTVWGELLCSEFNLRTGPSEITAHVWLGLGRGGLRLGLCDEHAELVWKEIDRRVRLHEGSKSDG